MQVISQDRRTELKGDCTVLSGSSASMETKLLGFHFPLCSCVCVCSRLLLHWNKSSHFWTFAEYLLSVFPHLTCLSFFDLRGESLTWVLRLTVGTSHCNKYLVATLSVTVTFPSEGQYWKDIKKCWARVPPCHQQLQPRLWNWENSQNYKMQVMGMQGPQRGDPSVAASCHLPCAPHTGQTSGSGWLLPSAPERCLLTPDNCFVKTTHAPEIPSTQ